MLSHKIDNSHLDDLFSLAYWHLKKKGREYFYSKPPQILADEVIEELLQEKKHYESLIRAYQFSFPRRIEQYIKEVKRKNQLIAFEISSPSETGLEEKILKELKVKYPRAFVRRRKRTRKKYGCVQVQIEFSFEKAATLLSNPYFRSFLDSITDEDNPLMRI